MSSTIISPDGLVSDTPSTAPHATSSAPALLTEEQLTLLTLRFDENEFGYLPSEATIASASAGKAAHTTTAASNEAKGLASTELPTVASAFVAYSAYDFVRDKQEHMQLEDLKSDLTTFSRLLESKIMHHIHEDVHDAFVTVSGQLGNMSEPLTRAVQPLQAARKRLDRSLQHLGQASEAITKGLAEAQRHEVARQFHVTILQITLTHESACRVYEEIVAAQEGMNLVLPPGSIGGGVLKGSYTVRAADAKASNAVTAGGGTDDSVMRSKQWDSPSAPLLLPQSAATMSQHDALVESFVQHVLRLRTMWAALPYAAAFCPAPASGGSSEQSTAVDRAAAIAKIEEASAARSEAFTLVEETNRALQLVLGTALYDAYLSSLSTHASPADAAVGLRRFSHFLNMYKMLGDEKELSVVYRDVIVRPLIESVVSWKAVGEARKSTAVVTQILASIKQLLRDRVLHIVPLLRDTFGAAIHPIADIIWTAVCDTLVKRLVFLFSPSLPDVLHSNFSAAQEVLALLEEHCDSPQELYAMRNSSDMTMWLRKWNLDVYYVQRTQEATEAFEKLFAEANAYSPSSSTVPVAPTNASALTPAAADSTAVVTTLQSRVHRYHFHTALEGLADLMMKPFNKGHFLLPLGPRQLKLSITLLFNGLGKLVDGVRAASNGGNTLLALCLLLKDLSGFEAFVKNDFVAVAKAALGDSSLAAPVSPTLTNAPTASSSSALPQPSSSSSSSNHAMLNLLKMASLCVVEKKKLVSGLLQAHLLDASAPLLQQGLTQASTRANVSNAPCPSEPSRQVVEALAAFEQLEGLISDDSVSGAISREEASALLVDASKAMCAQYQSNACNALQSLYRRLKALQKVKRVAAGGGAAGGGGGEREVTDFEKMILQLYYDAQYIEQRLTAYVSVPMLSTQTAFGASGSSVFSYYFEPLMARGMWILQFKVRGEGDLSDVAPPALWPEVNEN